MFKRVLTGLVLMLTGIISAHGTEAINVLIVDGFSNHDWQHTTRILKQRLQDSENFDVSVSTFPADGSPAEQNVWNPDFSKFDAVIQNCNDIKSKSRWPRQVEQALESYVKKGGGLYIFHSANNSFPAWTEYNRMIGLGWRDLNFGWAITVSNVGEIIRVPAGEGGNTSHGKRIDAVLTRIGEHPIHQGFPRQWVASDIEVYRYARGPAENLTVLSYARDEKTGLNFPVEWVVEYGKGRVYNSTLGHVWHDQEHPEGMLCAGHQTLIPRVVQWVSKREVDGTMPLNFPVRK